MHLRRIGVALRRKATLPQFRPALICIYCHQTPGPLSSSFSTLAVASAPSIHRTPTLLVSPVTVLSSPLLSSASLFDSHPRVYQPLSVFPGRSFLTSLPLQLSRTVIASLCTGCPHFRDRSSICHELEQKLADAPRREIDFSVAADYYRRTAQ